MIEPKERRDNTEILVAIGKIEEKIESCVVPAISQTWKNKEDITAIKAKQGGMLKVMWLVGLSIVGVISRVIYKAFHG